jgi:uncharacterized protein
VITVLSPAKTLDFESPLPTDRHSVPAFMDHADGLMQILKGCSPLDLANLMNLSDSLSTLNVRRNSHWSRNHVPGEARQAIFAFQGDVYKGLEAETLGDGEIEWAQSHLRILSGLYGYLRPLDLVMPHRLEMGTSLASSGGSNLYEYWNGTITEAVAAELEHQEAPVLINLASQEYFRAIRHVEKTHRVITPAFKEHRPGGPRVIGVHAKKQRGRMARHIINNRIDTPEPLKEYSLDGYSYAPDLSTESEWVFVR